MRVLFPDPLTPVTATSDLKGTSTSNPQRLLVRTSRIVSLSCGGRLCAGMGMD